MVWPPAFAQGLRDADLDLPRGAHGAPDAWPGVERARRMRVPAAHLVEPPELRKARQWWEVVVLCADIEQAAKKFLRLKTEDRADARAESDAEH